MSHPGWALVVVGVVIAVIGLVWLLAPSIPWLGRLPGDIVIERESFRFYFPVTTCVLLSLLLIGIMWVAARFPVKFMPTSRASAGLLMYRTHEDVLQVLLVHPGGPFFKNKDDGVWSIPKGEVEPGEDLLECAKREFAEETGVTPTGSFAPLMPVTQKSGKVVHAWAFAGDTDLSPLVSGTFKMEWPPRSERLTEFPEIDRAEFFDTSTAKRKFNPAQVALIDELERVVNGAK